MTSPRVLIVDDRDDNRYYLRKLFEGAGYAVDEAHHGAEALTRAGAAPPDLVISDLLMPVMDGYTLLRRWRADAALRAIPFVVYTSTYTSARDEQLARDLGADAFVLKPAEPDDLLARVRALGPHVPAAPPTAEAPDAHLREYSEVLVHKLEAKMLELERTNRSLERDIAARVAVESALRDSEENFRALIESMPQLVWITDAAGANQFANRRWSEYTGLTAAETRGDGWARVVHPDDLAEFGHLWHAALAGGHEFVAEARVRGADGTYRYWLIRAVPIRDGAARVTRFFGTCTDIDDSRRAAERLREAESQLRQAQKMEAIGRLAAGLAHDFNNLLSVILTYSTLLLDDLPGDAPSRADVAEIARASQRATTLTRQLLALGRQQVLQPTVLELGGVVRALEPLLARMLGEQIDLAIVDRTDGATVYADPSQVEQIVMNLAVNARDAMPDGGRLAITVATTELTSQAPGGPAAGRYVSLEVTDSGTGMPPEVRARVFEPFFTTKSNDKGTGLGLATVFGIVSQSRGAITVDSTLGRGSTFVVYLPRTDGTRADPEDGDDHAERADVAGRGGETLLLVEDDEQLRRVMLVVLRRCGYTVLECATAGDALIAAEKHAGEIQLLLTDVVLPRMDGRELADRLLRVRPHLRVVYISGYAPEDLAAARRVPGTLLAKPITPDLLLRAVREALDA